MKCQKAQRWILEQRDLSPLRRMRLERHVSVCPVCSKYAAELEQLSEVARRIDWSVSRARDRAILTAAFEPTPVLIPLRIVAVAVAVVLMLLGFSVWRLRLGRQSDRVFAEPVWEEVDEQLIQLSLLTRQVQWELGAGWEDAEVEDLAEELLELEVDQI